MRCHLELSKGRVKCWGHVKPFLVKHGGGDPDLTEPRWLCLAHEEKGRLLRLIEADLEHDEAVVAEVMLL